MARTWSHRLLIFSATGVVVSFAVHSALGGVAVADWLWGLFPAESVAAVEVASARPEPNVEITVATFPMEASVDPATLLPDGEEIFVQMADPRWQEIVESSGDDDAYDDERLFVSVELMRIAREAERRSTDENLAKLEQLSERLTDVSTEKSVADINARLRQVLGAEARAAEPSAAPVKGEFDFGTAQLHDVKREKDASGVWVYTAILVDSAGRKFESPMDPSGGETAYRTMLLIKSNPLLEKVYRGVVMSILDQALEGAK